MCAHSEYTQTTCEINLVAPVTIAYQSSMDNIWFSYLFLGGI